MAQCRLVASSFLSTYRAISRTTTLLKRYQRGLTALLAPSWSVSFLPAVQRCAYTMDSSTPGIAASNPPASTSSHLESTSPQTDALGAQGAGVVAVGEGSCDSGEGSHDKCESSATGVQDRDGERYAYIQRGFTSEIYKIELINLPPFLGYKQLRKRLTSLELNPVKIKMVQKEFCFVTFRSEEDRQNALQKLNGLVWKNKKLSAKVAAPAVDPLYKRKRKAKGDSSSDVGEGVKRACRDILSPEERMADAVTPLHKKPYEEQLDMKMSSMREFLKKAALVVQRPDSNPGEWFKKLVEASSGLLCPLEPIAPSPVQTEYRNKCEFTVAIGDDGKPVVGFRVSSYEEGDLTVVSPDSCVHIPQLMKDLVKAVQEYFCGSSLTPYSQLSGNGNWRQVAIRCFTTGESMIVIQLHPQQLAEEDLVEEKHRLREYFTEGEGAKCSPTSLYIQRKMVTSDQTDYEHILGAKQVHESLLDMKFRISPDAFFQVNTRATEVLYSVVQRLCSSRSSSHASSPDPSPSASATPAVVYDICCGTGTIGLFLAKAGCPGNQQIEVTLNQVIQLKTLSLKCMVGVEMVSQAIEDARVNANINGITTADFVCGKAEDTLPKVLENKWQQMKGEVVGVVDPPRNGLHPLVIQAIRKCSAIRRLVYVSCNPEGALSNFVDLCRRKSNRIRGAPFQAVLAVPVDLFPQTRHCELVVLFERAHPETIQAQQDGTTSMKDMQSGQEDDPMIKLE